jgi:adenylate cyclase
LDEIKILSSVLEGERNKSDDLLLNILPASIAERLKWGETTIVDTFESATVIFTDMVGFTKIASKVSAEELIVILNRMFSEFDKLAEKHGVEKIKTIGDAYMAVAGVPIPNEFHAEAVADMALDIMLAINNLAEKENLPISIRAGIHTGYLTAGVIGEKKFAYDLWGDTVNTASRMESSGEPGRVQCSEATYRALKDTFDFEERGTIEVKGKGAMKTYFVLGRKK